MATVSAHPSKAFFVDMLTRDIELRDAVLDLIDNCIDGIQRQIAGTPAANSTEPFQGFFANIKFDRRSFSIVDNCGGIPRNVAEQYAFRLGRPSGIPKEKIPTVGVYGIGMKRAMFKIGRSSNVTTVNAKKAYSVAISPAWMKSDNNWDLPILELKATDIPERLKGYAGTLIEVANIEPVIQQEFDRQTGKFEEDLVSTVATHYSYIIHKGFAITINDNLVKAKALSILVSGRSQKKNRIDPFAYVAESNGVKVDLIVGLYRNIPSEAEVEAELEGKQGSGSRGTCGWTIICNDRVVVYNDKSRLTGWGDATVPAYHPQFNAIAGVVRFQSDDMSKLPVTTTKRGLEAGSELYLAVRDVMREGLKVFTNFTNHWKGHGTERDALMAQAQPTEPAKATSLLRQQPDTNWTTVRKGLGGTKFVPHLPKPKVSDGFDERLVIRYLRKKDEIDAVADLIFGRGKATPAEVGEACFDRMLERAKK